jgi:tripartite ATP-independent transporter DctM subunit
MIWWQILAVTLSLKIFFFMAGLPIFLCFILIVGGTVLILFGSTGYGMFVNSLYTTGATEALTSVPLFVMMGEVLMRSGSIDVLFNAIDKLIGRLRGRQYHMTLALSAIVGAPAGSGIAVAAMLGRSVMGSMLKRGYDPALTSGTIMAGAMLAPIIPPSVVAIIIGTLADVSIADLLLAGIIPGIVLTIFYIGAVAWSVWRNPALAPEEEFVKRTGREKLRAVLELIPFSVIIFVSIGLIMFDFATPSEAAALGVLASILEGVYRRAFGWKAFFDAAGESAVLSAVILIIMATAVLFGQVLAYTGAIQELGKLAGSLNQNPLIIFALMMVVPFILCMFVDQIALMLVLIPIFEPVIKSVPFDPVWFYMQFLITMVVASIMPPFGYFIFALKAAVPNVTLAVIYRGAWLFVGVSIFGIALFTVFPAIITWVPKVLK